MEIKIKTTMKMKTFTQIINNNYTYYAFYLMMWLLIGIASQCLYQIVIDAVAATQVVPVVPSKSPEGWWKSVSQWHDDYTGHFLFFWGIFAFTAAGFTPGVIGVATLVVIAVPSALGHAEQIDSLPNAVQPDTLAVIYDTCVANEGLIWLIFMMCLIVYVLPIARETLKA